MQILSVKTACYSGYRGYMLDYFLALISNFLQSPLVTWQLCKATVWHMNSKLLFLHVFFVQMRQQHMTLVVMVGGFSYHWTEPKMLNYSFKHICMATYNLGHKLVSATSHSLNSRLTNKHPSAGMAHLNKGRSLTEIQKSSV